MDVARADAGDEDVDVPAVAALVGQVVEAPDRDPLLREVLRAGDPHAVEVAQDDGGLGVVVVEARVVR